MKLCLLAIILSMVISSCSFELPPEKVQNRLIKLEQTRTTVFDKCSDSLFYAKLVALNENADAVIEHINTLKAKLFTNTIFGEDSTISKEVYKNGKFLIGLDSVKVISGIADYITPTELMIGGNPNRPLTETPGLGANYSAVYLRNLLTNFKNEALQCCKELSLQDSLKILITDRFYFKLKNDVVKEEEEWTVRNFYHVPLAAVTAQLSTLQWAVRKTVLEMVNSKCGE